MKQKNKRLLKFSLCLALVLAVSAVLYTGIYDAVTPDSISISENEAHYVTSVDNTRVVNSFNYTSKAFGLIPVKNVNVDVVKETYLIPGGDVFGVKFFTRGIIVIGMSDIETENSLCNPAERAGLKVKDIIVSVNGKGINSIEEMTQIVEKSNGNPLKLVCERDGQAFSTTITPELSVNDGVYKTGIWVRDSTAGIGTVTFYNPENNTFGGLGHGICDVDTGKLMPLLKGSVVDVEITKAVKGMRGSPGELKGDFSSIEKGKLLKNTSNGVFGILNNAPKSNFTQPVKIGLKNEVREGDAVIYCNVDGESVEEYSILIEKIYKNSDDGKNFVVSINDPDLLQKTGGIIQGMSGSPILQNGRIVGAVTHVFVNDPTRGYGIFIENMLAEAEKIK